jgi:hypothetical protein
MRTNISLPELKKSCVTQTKNVFHYFKVLHHHYNHHHHILLLNVLSEVRKTKEFLNIIMIYLKSALNMKTTIILCGIFM